MFFTYILGSQRLTCFYVESGNPEAYIFLHRFWDTRGSHAFLHRFLDNRGSRVFYIDSGNPEAYMFFT